MAIKIIGSTIIDDSRNIVNAGIATVTSVSIGNTQVVSSARQLQNIASLDATTTATIEAAIQNAPNTFTDLSVSGISTLGVTSATNLTAQQLNISGVSTLGITTFTGAVSFGTSAYFGDNDNLYFGDGDDLRIYHDSSTGDSIIRENGTGNLRIGGINISFTSPAGTEAYANFNVNGAVELYHDNSKKFETTGVGATVFGTLQSQQLNISGISSFIGKIVAGNGIGNTNLSNTLDYNSTAGINAFRSINLVDSAAAVKISRTSGPLNGAAIELQTWDVGIVTNYSYWDVNAENGYFGIRDRKTGVERTRLFIDDSGSMLLGADSQTFSNNYTQLVGIGTDKKLNVLGKTYISDNVGIGTTNPVTPLHISDGNGGISTALYTSDYLTISAQNTAPGFNIIAAGSASAQRGVFKATRAGGTLSSPTVPLVNDNVFSLLGNIYDGSTGRATAAINMDVDGTVGLGTAPQRITFWTGTGSSRLERARIQSTGEVLIGSATSTGTASQPLQVTGGAYISGSLGMGTTNPTKPLHIYTTGGDIRIGDITEGTPTTDAGVIFTGLGTVTSALFTEVGGTILSYGINCEQIIGFETGRAGGVFRLDTRTSGAFGDANCFVVKGRPLGSTTEYNAIVVGLNDGNTYLSPVRGNVLVGTSTETGTTSQRLQVTGGAYVSGNVGVAATNPLARLSIGSGSIADVNTPVQISTPSASGQIYYGANNNGSYGALFGYDRATYTGGVIRVVGASDNIEFVVNNTTRAATITSAGNLGIGTTNPSDKLHVLGNTIRIDSASGALAFWNGAAFLGGVGLANVLGGSGTDLAVRSDPGRGIIFFTGGANDRGRIDANGTFLVGSATSTGTASQRLQVGTASTPLGAYVSGSVGIGTTNPQTKLDVIGIGQFNANGAALNLVGTDHSYIQWYPDGTAAGRKAYVGYPNASANYFEITNEISDGSGHIYLNPGANASVLIDTTVATGTTSQSLQVSGGAYVSGNLGVGQTNPTRKLYVHAAAGDGIFVDSSDATGNTNSPTIRIRGQRVDSNGSQSFAGTLVLEKNRLNGSINSGQNLGNIIFGGNFSTLPGITTGITYGASISGVAEGTFSDIATAPTAIVFNTGTAGIGTILLSNLTYGTEAARITSNRNLLIGSSSETGTSSQRLQVTGGGYFSGNLGVGATNPGNKLVIAGETAQFPISLQVLSTLHATSRRAAIGLGGTIGAPSPDWQIVTDTQGNGTKDLTFYSTALNSNVFNIQTSGNSVFANFPVLIGTGASTGTASQQLQVNTGGAYVSGNLGIGNTNPGAKLDVAGDIRLSAADAEIEFNTGGARLKGRTNALSIHTGSGLDSEASEQVRINTTGVGIGTTNPTSRLSVVGDVLVAGVTTANSFRARGGAPGALGVNNNGYGFFGSGDNDSGMYSSADNQIEFYTNSGERVRINSTGVGIGTINPVATLQVKDALAFETTNTTTTNTNQVAVDTFATATFRSAKYQAQITCPGQISVLGGITTGGRGYTAGTYNVTFTTSSGNGSAAQGTLVVSNGTVGQIGLGTTGGSGYVTGDVLTASGGSGLQVSVASTASPTGRITGLTLSSAGIGYTGYYNATTGTGTTSFTFLGGTGTGAVGLATIFDGVITSSTLLQQPTTGTGGTTYYSGSNYSTASVLSITRSDLTNTITTITGSVGVSTFTSLTAHGIGVSDVVRVSSTSNGLTAGVDYYVVTVPSTTTFTLGSAVGVGITFTTGTSLSIGFFRNSARDGGQVTYTNAITGVSTNHQVSDLMVLQNGTTADFVEYATIANDDILGTFAADISGANARLLFTPTYPNNTIKVARQAITV
jgi:hypothetical protein